MRKLLFLLLLVTASCASKSRQPASVDSPIAAAAAGTFDLEQALTQGPMPTFAHLKSKSAAKSFDDLNGKDPAASLPDSLRAERPAPMAKEKGVQMAFIRKFRPWPLHRKLARSQTLVENFSCEKAVETQSMAFSLEVDFPAEEAMTTSRDLHEKVLSCSDYPKQESLFRLTVFSIQKGDCPKAVQYLDKFPADAERGVHDRANYLRGLCSKTIEVTERNPWGGYGILLADVTKKDPKAVIPRWTMSATSGSEDWDRLLISFITLYEQGHPETVQYLANKISYDKFRTLPLPFQTAMMTVMSFSGADLAVFQTLHKYLSLHPEMATVSVQGLLFPTRFWPEIVENSKSVDPILVKALIRQESAFNPAARSRAKAAGLMQLIYPTAKIFGIKKPKQLLSPEDNIHAGSEFLSKLIAEFGSVELALAAYNAGPAIVHQWQRRYPTDNVDLFVEMIPYTETREYVRLVTRNYKVYQAILSKPQILGDLAH